MAEAANELKTLTSNNATSSRPPQKPLALMSRCLLSSAFVAILSTDGITGSVLTSMHTSAMVAGSRSRISLCLTDGSPPVGQLSACVVLKTCPQMHVAGSLGGLHPYLRHKESRISFFEDGNLDLLLAVLPATLTHLSQRPILSGVALGRL